MEELFTFFNFPTAIRQTIYSTNLIEHIGDSRTVTTRLIRCFRIANSCGRSFLFYTTFLTLSILLTGDQTLLLFKVSTLRGIVRSKIIFLFVHRLSL
ncbi:transposase [Limosilactobacillus fermentum]|uniref:transposase n=1 Tax=Limosilactobacillus fermentum TaxID=1613 RepID=UPI0022E94C2E|nr:transposase [Limosilactobacillus fermentum]